MAFPQRRLKLNLPHRHQAFFIVETAYVFRSRIFRTILFVPLLSAEAGLCVVRKDTTARPEQPLVLPGGFFVATV